MTPAGSRDVFLPVCPIGPRMADIPGVKLHTYKVGLLVWEASRGNHPSFHFLWRKDYVIETNRVFISLPKLYMPNPPSES